MLASSCSGFRRTATSGPSSVARVLYSVMLLSTLAIGAAFLLASPPPSSAQISDLPGLALSINPATITEGSSDVEVTVTATLDESEASAVTVVVSVGNGGDTATEGTDYPIVDNFNLTIASGRTSGTGTFKISSTDNNIAGELSKTITITGIRNDVVALARTRLTITDNDSPPTSINLSIEGNGVEGDTKKLTAVAEFPDGSATLASATTVTLTLSSGTAISGTDFTAESPFNVIIERGKPSGKTIFDLSGLEDSVVEGGENINVSATASGFTINTTQITFLDNDITFSLDADTNTTGNQNTVREDINTKVIRIIASLPGSNTLSTNTVISITVGKESDSATKGVDNDYTVTDPLSPSSYTVTIPAGSSEAFTNFTMNFNNDTKHENDETINFVGLSSDFHVGNAELIIRDNDIKLSVTPGQVYETVGIARLTVVATLPEGSVAVGAIPVIISAGQEGDIATKGIDFTELENVVVTIPDGEKTGSVGFNFTVLDDRIYDTNESVTFHGSFRSTDVTNIGKYGIDKVRLTIEEPRQFWIDLFVYTFRGVGNRITDIRQTTISEGSTGTLRARIVAKNANRNGTVSITYGGSATLGTSDSSGDYSISSSSMPPPSPPPTSMPSPPLPSVFSTSLPFTYETLSSFVDVPFSIVDDNIAENPETILVFGNLSDGSYVEGDSITIIDNDVAPDTINLTVDADTSTDGNQTEVSESVSSHTISVTATFPDNSVVLPDPVSLTISVSGNGGSGEAKSTDFEATNLTLTIPAGSTRVSGSFTLSGTDDDVAGSQLPDENDSPG